MATGRHSEMGAIHTLMGDTRAPETPMQHQLNRMSTQLVLLSGAVCAGVFVLGLMRGYGWLAMFKSAISLAVAALPEGLPAVATTTLALGIQAMRRQKVLIRSLPAVETLGAVRVFCLDKTGTLTLNRMTVAALYVNMRPITVDEGFRNGAPIDPQQNAALRQLLRVISLCSEATGEDALAQNGSPTENALFELALKGGVDINALRHAHPRLKVRYRAENRPFMYTVHADEDQPDDRRQFVALKGSPEQVLTRCRWHLCDGQVIKLSELDRARIRRENERMADQALRVLGMAYARVAKTPDSLSEVEDQLTWLGLVGMADPLRAGVKAVIERFDQAGIESVMVTGDQSATAFAIARQIDLARGDPLKIIDASQTSLLDTELTAQLEQGVHVFARVSPAHKLEVVQAMQRTGKVVAMTGDGVNDAPALKAADVGVAVGRSGTDAARSIADVVLEDDDLRGLIIAVRQGRTVYGNIRKSIHFLLATNLSEIEVMLTALALNAGQPLSAMQLLWINLVTDIFPALALALEPPEPDVLNRPPRDPARPVMDAGDFRRLGLESGVISLGALTGYGYGLTRYGAGPKAGTLAFLTLTFAQLLHALSCRSDTTTIFKARGRPSNPYLNWALGGSLALQASVPLIPGLRQILGVAPIGLMDMLMVGMLGGLPLLINEATKQGNMTNNESAAATLKS